MTPNEKLKLVIYVVYESPRDYPLARYVVRRWVGLDADKDPLAVTDDLAEARAAIPDYTTLIGRSEQDDPAIKEVWI